MAKKKQNFKLKLFQFILFFSLLLSFIKSDLTWIYYDHIKEYSEFKATNKKKEETYALEFGYNSSLPYYIKVIITPETSKPTPLLFFSNEDTNCNRGRQALAKRTDGKPAFIFIKREQIQNNDQELFIKVICPESTCSYTLTFKGEMFASIEANSVYSYLITKYNKEMNFRVYGDVEDNSYLTIGIEGSYKAQLSIDGILKETIFDNGRIVTFPLDSKEKSSYLTQFVVKNSIPGEYITISLHIIKDNKSEDNLLIPNGPNIMGLIDKNDFSEECFPISAFTFEKYKNINKFYLTGTIYSKNGIFYLADEEGMFIEGTEIIILNGKFSYLIQPNGKKLLICFEFMNDALIQMDYIAFSISIFEPTTLESIYNYYPPQILGQFYRRMIPKGNIGVFHGGNFDISKKYNYNLLNRKGVAEMYITKCNQFPDCQYTDNDLNNMILSKKINKISIWDKHIEEYNTFEALNSNKEVMVIYCKDDDNKNNGYCEFDTLIYTDLQIINLMENEKFYKFILKDEKGYFKIDLKGRMIKKFLTIDIMIFSGDINFEIKGESADLKYYKYRLSNKILFYFNFEQIKLNDILIEIEYKAETNSFFSIKYEIDSFYLNQLYEYVFPGENYLVQIDRTTKEKSKNIYIPNSRYKMNQPFLTNFNALNCEFKITRENQEIPFYDGYAQDILYSNSIGYKSEYYNYTIKISEEDKGDYDNKMCMIYVTGYESQDNLYLSEIIIPENIKQKFTFNDKLKIIRFLYPYSSPENDLAIYINTINQSVYTVKIYAQNSSLKTFIVSKAKIYNISSSDILKFCEKDILCNIIIQIELNSVESVEKKEPKIELLLSQL